MNGLADWFGKNLTWIIGVTVATAVAWGTLNTRVNVIAQDYNNLNSKLDALQEISERLVRLEEGRRENASDIGEIKDDLRIIEEDIKDIKIHFEIR